MLNVVIFDIGGVLVHDVWEHLFFDSNGLGKKFNLSREKLQVVGKKIYKEYAYRLKLGNNDWHDLEQEYWRKFIDEFREELPESVTEVELIRISEDFIKNVNSAEMIPLLEELKSTGVTLAICSNNTPFWFHRQAEKFGILKFFDEKNIFLSYRIGVLKSHPSCAMFSAVIDVLGIKKDSCVFIDDRQENITRAEKCGIRGILFHTNSSNNVKVLRDGLKEIGNP